MAQQDDYEARLRLIAEDMAEDRRRRDTTIVAARQAGYTWRRIALAVGMTEMGVHRVYQRTASE